MLKRSLRAGLGIVLAVSLLELVIRQFWLHTRVWEEGYVKISTPNTTSVWRTEGDGLVHRLSHGERAGYFDGVPKVLVLGDSFTEALEVNDDEVYTAVAQARLAAAGKRLGIVNAGLAGRSVADYTGFAPRHKRFFAPVWTVVTIRDDDLAEDTVRPEKTSFRRDANGKLTVSFDEARSVNAVRDFLWENPSDFFRYTFYRLHKFGEAWDSEPPMFRAASEEARKKASAAKLASPEQLEQEYRQYPVEEEIDQLAAAYDGKLTIVTLPYLTYNASGQAELKDSPVRRRLLAHCAARGLSYVEPGRAFLELAAAKKSPFGFPNTRFNYGHMNRDGHRIVGEELARELERLQKRALF